jgi:Protein of unknown function (DUF2384)
MIQTTSKTQGSVNVADLVRQVQSMVAESGNPEGFDAAQWVDGWLNRPCWALGGDHPFEWMVTSDRQARVVQILACTQSGAYL